MVPRFTRLLPLFFACSVATDVLAQSADLSVTVTMPATSVYSASDEAATANGQFMVKNAGPSIAQNVTIDFGPYVSAAGDLSGFSCGLTNGRYLCTTISMVPGTISGTFLIKWPLAQNGTVETTTVQVTSASPVDADTTNNSASANTTVVWQADLQLTEIDVPSRAAPGVAINVIAHYSNLGPSPASGFKLTITIPPGATGFQYNADEWLTCTPPPKGHGDLVCTAPSLPPLEGFVEAVVWVDPAPPGTVVTFPVTTTSTTGINPSVTKSGSLTVLAPATMHVGMSAPASTPAGETFETTIVVTNFGSTTAFDTMVKYFIVQGPGLLGQMKGPAGWTCADAICKTDSFAPGTATFTIDTFIQLDTTAPTLTEEVNTFSASDPYSPGFVIVTTAITQPPKAALKVTLNASPDPVYGGDQLTYTAQIANTSSADALNVSLLWALPAGNTVVATTCGTTDNPQCTFATIAAGATQTVTRTIHVNAGPGTLLTASASVTATNIDPQSASASTTVGGTPHVDLSPAITAPSRVRAGDSAEWIYSINNDGPDTVTDWQLTIPLPANTALTSFSTATPGACRGLTLNAVDSQVICHGTSIPFELRLVLTVTPGTTTPIHATASVSTANVDLNPQNDTVAVDSVIYTLAGLSVSATTDKTVAVTGEHVTQTLTITNDGPDAATGVFLDVLLPSSSIEAINSTFASCTGTAPIHCVAPSLAAGAELKTTIAFLAPATVGLYGSEVHLVWDNGIPGFTFAQIGLQVIAPPPASDVTIAVDATPVTVQPGDAVTYTLAATNIGGSPSSDVMVHFTLPPALMFLSAPPQCTGTSAITCTAGTVTSGSSATFAVTARALGAGSITTTATVSSSSSDANSGNNSGSATIVVDAAPTPARRRAARH